MKTHPTKGNASTAATVKALDESSVSTQEGIQYE